MPFELDFTKQKWCLYGENMERKQDFNVQYMDISPIS